MGKPAPLHQVQAAVKKLHDAQFIREHRGRLEAADAPRRRTGRPSGRTYLDPKPRERNEITRNVLREIFGEPALKTYRYKELRNFRIGVAVEGRDRSKTATCR